MKLLLSVVCLVPLFLLNASGAEQPRIEATPGAVREAIAKGQVAEALSALEAHASEAEANKDWPRAANAFNLASDAARNGGQLQKAVTYANKALEMAERAKEPGPQAQAISQLVWAYRSLGQYAKSKEWMDKGLEVIKKMGHGPFRQLMEANFYRMLGLDFLRQRQPQKAVEYISYSVQVQDERLSFLKRRALLNAEAIRNGENFKISTLYNLGIAYQRAGSDEEAIKSYERGIALVKEIGLKTPLEVNLYYGLGDLYLNRKDHARALENLQRALEMAEQLRLGFFVYQASSRIGNLYVQTQRPVEAIPYYKKAIDNVESTRSLLESEEFRSAFFEDKRGIYAGMIVANLRAKNVEEAFNYGERARSRAFLDILGSRVQLARGGSLLEEERALQGRISTLQARMAGQESDDGSVRGQLRRELEEAQKAYNDFLAKVRKENKEQASLMSVEPLTLKQAQELLDPGVTMLEYFVTQQAVLLWVVEKDRVRFVNIPLSRKDLVAKVSSLRESVFQVGEREKFKASSQELFKLLIEPALKHIRGKELLIIPHDVLHYLPFQALLSAQDKYLIQDYPIYYLSSASLMQFTHEKRRASGERALVMGNPSLGDEAYNLRFAEREAKEVARLYPKSAVYLRAEASKPRAVSLSPGFEMLHFAVHAELNEEDPMSSALLLAGEGKEDGRLRVGEIFSLNLKAGMVVLSACETGLGKLSNGDEMVGLTRAFIYAGTPSIVTTLWKVNDRSSYELMREFYANLKSGKKSEALRKAQLKTMAEFPEPFYWAAYQLTGEP
jgi:CHAT domain-containing protein